MSKLNRKFLISIAVILMLISALSIYLNNNFIERYYLYQEKQELKSIATLLLESNEDLSESISNFEDTHSVTIVQLNNTLDNDKLNIELRDKLIQKGISFQKYWLWDKDQAEISKKGSKIKVYSQDNLNYSLLIEYTLRDEKMIAIVKTVPAMEKTLLLISKVNAIVFVVMSVLIFICITYMVKKVTLPLKTIGSVSNSIANLDFKTIKIKTNDELETLAEDINTMSKKLKESHYQLIAKNRDMETLLANVSHDLKTPISLIKMYSQGMKDGLDDGTFVDTIIKQNNNMQSIVEKLLLLAKVKEQQTDKTQVDAAKILKQLLDDFGTQIATSRFTTSIIDFALMYTNPEALYIIFSNTISNALKYSSEGSVNICLRDLNNQIVFDIENKIDNNTLEVDRIWEPFYVADKSRNNELTGTGLGLSIVKAACEANDISYDCQTSDSSIKFTFIFNKTK